jgi:acyl transferase domain-containing protein
MAEQTRDAGEWTGLEVAIVGMAGCFPGAADVEAFWRNLRDGVEAISRFTREELLEAGVEPSLLDNPAYVPAGGALDDADRFDAAFFDLTPRDAEILNPQQRVFLERAWEALEHAGYDPGRIDFPVGVFAGSGTNSYIINLLSNSALVSALGPTRISLGNDKDHLATGISYRLNLRGPSVSVQTACSTSLVAAHLACQSLINAECDLALAGGVSIQVPLRHGYLYRPDGISSPDGHCRAFDAEARGAIGGNGAAVVVLKRLSQALEDGDTVHAVIRGSAINNDGSDKVGFTAPSVNGQAKVIAEALAVAGVEPADIQYLETHGTGTPLGDAIELRALKQVFDRPGGRRGRTAIGSVKTNVGHLDAAAGVAGLIKATLSLANGEIPPSLNCSTPNPEIAAPGTPLFVNTTLRPWERNGAPRRAGVSSFGIGGTNAHVVLEEAPAPMPSAPSRDVQLLIVSARTGTALRSAAERLADHLERGGQPLADVAYTLQTGRRPMEHRLAVACRGADEAVRRLRGFAASGSTPVRMDRPVAFLFPGLGLHHVDMGRGLYDAEPAFRAAVDECCEILRPLLEADLREVLYPAAVQGAAEAGGGWDLRKLLGRGAGGEDAAAERLNRTRFAHPAVFVTEYALARLWVSWGVRPAAVIGHSLGEYVAACAAGVFPLEDALRLVAIRAQLIDGLPEGAMLAVPLAEEELRAILPEGADLAAVNTPQSSVASGPPAAVGALEEALAAREVVTRRVPTGHAFHSREMAPVAAELQGVLGRMELRAPEVPLVSNVTGTWITDAEACSPAYWARHLCETVRFSDGLGTLREHPGWALLEVGPGQTLGAWALQHPANAVPENRAVFSSLRHAHNRVPDQLFLLETLGQLWAAGVEVDWAAFTADEERRRVPLPTYPFERRRFWVEAPRRIRPQAVPVPVEAAAPAPADEPLDPTAQKGTEDMKNRLAAVESAALAPAPRKDAILDRLKEMATELTGVEEQYIATDIHFFQAGIDSLLLLQAIQGIEKALGVRVSLVELLEEITTLDALAAHLDGILPPEALAPANGNGKASHAAPQPEPAQLVEPPLPAPVPQPAGQPAPAPQPQPAAAPVGDSILERVIGQQMHLMAQQLEMLRGGTATVQASAPAPAPVPSSAAPAPAPSPAAAPAEQPQPRRARHQPETFVPFQPINNEAPGGLTAQQKEYLDDFMARYVARTRGSRTQQERFHPVLADGRVTAKFRRAWKEITYPIFGERAAGSRIWDVDGNEYVDVGMGFGCNLFGHAPDFVSRALQEQIAKGYGLGPQSALAGRAAELVCELGGNDRAIFCNSGTEALMGAIRGARTFTGRNKIAYFEGSYHGWSDSLMGRVIQRGGKRELRPSAPGITQAPLQDVLMLEYDNPASLDLLKEHLHEIAVVLVEPVQSRRPDIQPRAFLHELRRVTREAGTLLLFDELVTGFRLQPGGAQAFFGVEADLATYGKIVAGGMPMGVVSGRREVMDVYDGGAWRYGDDSFPPAQRTFFAGAFFKHPLSMSVTCAVMEEIRRRGMPMYDQLDERTTGLVDRLNGFFEAGRFPLSATNCGSFFRFFTGRDVKLPELFPYHLIAKGVHTIPETGTMFLSTEHTGADVDTVFRAVCEAVEEMRQGGLIAAPQGAPEPQSPLPVAVSTVAGRKEAGVRTVPLTDGQRQLWIESQMGDDASLAYIESVSLHLYGDLDARALGRAVQGLVDRHDALRTTFGRGGDVQVIHPEVKTDLPRVDFSNVPAATREAKLRAWIEREVQKPFDLAEGPLVRFALAGVEPERHLLLVTNHHAILDGWSFGILLRELGALYAAAKGGTAPGLPAPQRFAEVASRAAARDEAALDRAESFWLQEFADGVPVLELPTDRPRPPVRGYRGDRINMEMDPSLVERLSVASRKHGFTLFNTQLAAFYVWLGRLSGQEDMVVGVPSAGQAGSADAGVMGYNINVLPLRGRPEASLSFVEHARRVRRSLLRGIEHQGFSFPRLVEKLMRTRDPGRSPLFSVMFNVDPGGAGDVFLGDLRVETESNFGGGAKFDLNVNLTEGPGELSLYCDYDTDLFDRETVGRWLASFERLLQSIAERPEGVVGELEAVPDEDLNRLLDDFTSAALEC